MIAPAVAIVTGGSKSIGLAISQGHGGKGSGRRSGFFYRP